MIRHMLIAPAAAVLFALSCVQVNAANHHVHAAHPAASDSNPGTTDAPLLTIARAVELAMPGDTVFITGVYHEVLLTQRSGNSGAPIVFAAAPGAQAVLDGSVGDPGENGVVSTHSWLRFEGLEIRHWPGNGMWFEGGEGLVIRDCEVHQVFYGIGMTDGCHDFLLERVLLHDFDLYGFDASPGTLSCHDGTFIDCVSHTGRDPSQNVDGFALGHGDQRGFLFRNCVTYGVFDGFDISSRETTLESCLARDCLNGGYKLWQDEILLVNCLGYRNTVTNVELDWDGDPGSVTLTNCTFHDAGTFNIWVENSADTLFMHNCIVSGGDLNGLAFELRDTRSYVGDYNLFQNDDDARMINVGYEDQYTHADLAGWTAATGQDAHSIALFSIDGVFADAAGYDLHLATASPARDAGRALGAPPVDYDGHTRPDGAAVDIGAFEYQSGTSAAAGPALPSLTLTAWPNPASGIIRFRIDTERAQSGRLAVFDLLGRLRHAEEIDLRAGSNELSWDGRAPGGSRLHGCCVAVLFQGETAVFARFVLR